MTEDEVAAIHEAAHAVFAEFSQWTRLAGPVILQAPGNGDVVIATDIVAIRRSIEADPGFDRELPRIHLVRCLLAGPIAERILAHSGRAALCDDDLQDASSNDYAIIADQLDQLRPPRPDLLGRLERDVRRRLEQPANWSAVERFAAILIERRRLQANEASEILQKIKAEVPVDVSPLKDERLGRRAALAALLLWELWWAWEFFAAPRPDMAMRTVVAVFLAILPVLLIGLVGIFMLGYRMARRNR